VVGGHTHSAVAHRVQGVPVVQAFYWGQAFSRVDLTVDTASRRVVGSRVFPPQWICKRESGSDGRCAAPASASASAPVYEGRPVTADATVKAAMAPALQRIADRRARPVGVSLDAAVPRGDRDAESPLGNLFADAMRASIPDAEAALGYSAGPGGLRAGLVAGPVTVGAVYDLFPFDNRVVRVEATGADLRRLLTDQVQRPRFRSRSLGLSGLVVTMTCGAGGMQADVRHASGAPIGDAERLVIATTDFMAARFAAEGADPEAGRARPPSGTHQDAPLLREVVRGWLRAQGPRLAASRFADPSRPRWLSVSGSAGDCGAR
jgi:5'-nucleotidase